MDPITKYYEDKGITPVTAYFGQSNYEVGKTVSNDEWTMTYRVENNEVIICEFETFEKTPKGMKSIVSTYLNLIKMFKTLPGINRVKGMVQSDLCLPWQDQEKKQLELLKKIYIKNGAVEEMDEDGDTWIVY